MVISPRRIAHGDSRSSLVAFSDRLEEYRWSFGRPVFKKVDGEPRFLFVSRFGTWMIADSVTSHFPHNKWKGAKLSHVSPGWGEREVGGEQLEVL